jgi:hypothetical protein
MARSVARLPHTQIDINTHMHMPAADTHRRVHQPRALFNYRPLMAFHSWLRRRPCFFGRFRRRRLISLALSAVCVLVGPRAVQISWRAQILNPIVDEVGALMRNPLVLRWV